MESVDAVEVFAPNSARYRYRVPVATLRELAYEGSRYSQEFEVGGWLWRFHIQERQADGERFLALHLQSCTHGAVAVHFKLVAVCMRDPLQSRSKTFQCTFKKAGSAWGLHQFVPMHLLLSSDQGFSYTVEGTGVRCVDFEAVVQVQSGPDGMVRSMPPERDGSRPTSRGRYPSPQPPRRPGPAPPGWGSGGGGGNNAHTPAPSVRGGVSNPAAAMYRRSPSMSSVRPPEGPGPREAWRAPSPGAAGVGGFRASPGRQLALVPDGTANSHQNHNRPRAPLVYPFEHLEDLCDMSFDVQGVRVKAHRCVIGARMQPLLPDQMLPLQVGCIVAIAVPLDVFTTFLRYVYTEEYPERGVLPAESLLDLYLLATACEFYDVSEVCLNYVKPLLTTENILPIVLTRYNAADEVLTSLYLEALLQDYDILIQDKTFEQIPGHLFRRLSLILYNKESVPVAPIPAMKNSLGKQLAWLVETGEYSDYDFVVAPQQYTIRAHRYILASRCILFSQAFNSRNQSPVVPDFTAADYAFSLRSWQKLMMGMYRRHLETTRDFSAEDIAMIYKMHGALGMDGTLKKEAEEAFSNTNALRLLIYAVKHHIPELHDRAAAYVSSNFNELIQHDPQAWELIGELPQPAVVSLFRTVTENQQQRTHQQQQQQRG